MVDSEVQRLARQIYYTHKDAIDLIIEAIPDVRSEIRDIIESEVSVKDNLMPDTSSKGFVRFYAPDWESLPYLKGGAGWTDSGRMLLFEFRNEEKSLFLHLVLGPGPKDIRERVFGLAEREPNIFNNVPKSLTAKWNSLYRHQILRANDYTVPDMDSIAEKVKTRMADFIADDFGDIVRVIKEEFA